MSVEKMSKNSRARLRRKQQETTLSGNSISGSNIKWRIWMLLHKKVDKVAKEVWEFGNSVGVVSQGNEAEVISKLEEMKSRDRLAAVRVDDVGDRVSGNLDV